MPATINEAVKPAATASYQPMTAGYPGMHHSGMGMYAPPALPAAMPMAAPMHMMGVAPVDPLANVNEIMFVQKAVGCQCQRIPSEVNYDVYQATGDIRGQLLFRGKKVPIINCFFFPHDDMMS